ncbi:MAG: hypothetical protein BYD32DRAFT_408228 [Podila humilis]|nr:MAG: hypothetical protein BYD32DRAFT_408228 [Podila humilis]
MLPKLAIFATAALLCLIGRVECTTNSYCTDASGYPADGNTLSCCQQISKSDYRLPSYRTCDYILPKQLQFFHECCGNRFRDCPPGGCF